MHKILDVRVVLYLEDVQLKIFRAFYLTAFTSYKVMRPTEHDDEGVRHGEGDEVVVHGGVEPLSANQRSARVTLTNHRSPCCGQPPR